MPLFWIVHIIDGAPSIRIEEASAKVTARMKALLAGHGGEFAEVHELDDETAARVPERMRGRALDQREAAALLKRMG